MAAVQALAGLRATLRGELIARGDPGYERARKVYNGMIDRRPELIARCADTADVIAAVRFARAHGLRAAIRSGGHNAAGLGTCDDGIVIDLGPIRHALVDAGSETVRAGGGATWGDIDHATHAFGLAVPAGVIATTGVGGLTLGGGIGHLTRTYGLTIDNLLAAEVVLADGSVVTADERQHPDLFWALRGGGGNFGIVTSFLFRAHRVHTDYAGPMLWDLSQAGDILRWYREFIPRAPEQVNGFFAFLVVPPGPPFPVELHNRTMCAIVWCCPGAAAEEGASLLTPIRKLFPPVLDLAGPIPHPALQSMFDPLYQPGLQWYWKADFVDRIGDEAVAHNLEHAAEVPNILSGMHLYPINGAAHRWSNSDTAWSYRDATWAQVMFGVDPDPANRDKITAWAKSYWEDLHPFSAGGAYVNFMMDEGEDRVRATYRGNYQRLATIKARYDPENFFSVNQNIRPVAAGAA